MTSITHQMAEFAIQLKYEDIPAPAIKEAKRFLLDSVGSGARPKRPSWAVGH